MARPDLIDASISFARAHCLMGPWRLEGPRKAEIELNCLVDAVLAAASRTASTATAATLPGLAHRLAAAAHNTTWTWAAVTCPDALSRWRAAHQQLGEYLAQEA